MFININRDEFTAALAIVKRGVEKRSHVPVLSNVMLSAARGRLNIRSTDLDKETHVSIACETGHAGAVTLPGHALADLVKGLPKGAVLNLSVEKDASAATINCGQMKLSLQSLPIKDFPKFKAGALRNSFTLPAPVLLDALDKTAFAISTEETRYYLNGIFMHYAEYDSVLRFVATDGHRLARVEMPAPDGAQVIPGVIIPRAAVTELQKLLAKQKDDCRIELFAPLNTGAGKIRFTIGGAILTSKLIDGTFPDYNRVIPTGNDKRLVIDTKALIAAVTRVSKMSSERGRAIKLSLETDKLTLSVNNPDMGTVRETLDSAHVEFDGYLEIGFNAKYLLDILQHVESKHGTTQMMLSDPGSPTLFAADYGASMTAVLMPCRT